MALCGSYHLLQDLLIQKSHQIMKVFGKGRYENVYFLLKLSFFYESKYLVFSRWGLLPLTVSS